MVVLAVAVGIVGQLEAVAVTIVAVETATVAAIVVATVATNYILEEI
jgi:hypothetical protein